MSNRLSQLMQMQTILAPQPKSPAATQTQIPSQFVSNSPPPSLPFAMIPVSFAPNPAQPSQPKSLANLFIPTESHEIDRIINLSIVHPMDRYELEEYNRFSLLADAYSSGFRLFPAQAHAALAWELYQGIFGIIGVGWGKTLSTLMIAGKAYMAGLKKILLLVPSQVLAQLTTVDLRWARTKIPMPYQVHILGGRTSNMRGMMARSGKPGLYVLPYSCLSTKDTSEVLFAISPELIIADEAHHLASRSSARTKRIMEYVADRQPFGCVLSGTITSKKIQDYYHLIRWCLKQNNPLPNSVTLANDWGAIIDAQATKFGDAEIVNTSSGPLKPLIRWSAQNYPNTPIAETVAGFRKAYQLRLTSAPGVVCTGDSDIGTSLVMANRKAELDSVLGANELKQHINKVVTEWVTPNGDEIDHAIHTWKWLNELSAGFYNELSWPAPEVFAERKKISPQEATDILERAKIHHSLNQNYSSSLRKWLKEQSRQGLDTPMLVAQNMSLRQDADVGSELYELWQMMKDADFPDRPSRDSKAVRVCPYKIMHAIAWANEVRKAHKTGGLIWVWHQEIGEWCFEVLRDYGFDAIHCPAGEGANSVILDPANVDKFVVASIVAHGTGKNLQHFQHEFVLQWPRPAHVSEQMLGRTHRNGQKADELVVHTCHTLEFDELTFAACLNDSLYIHQTTGTRQKLIYATYDPVPKIFPPSLLKERGLQNHILTAEQEKALQDKFGLDTAQQ